LHKHIGAVNIHYTKITQTKPTRTQPVST